MAWVTHIKDGQPATFVLFDIEKCSAANCFIEKHRFAALPRQYWKILWRHENDIVGWIGVNGGRRHDPTYRDRHCHSAKTLRYLIACILFHRTFSLTVVFGSLEQQDFGTVIFIPCVRSHLLDNRFTLFISVCVTLHDSTISPRLVTHARNQFS